MDGWMPYYSRRHTDKELLSMQQHVEAMNRPAVNDLRAYRLTTAQEGRFMASITPTSNEARLRSLSAPGHTPMSEPSRTSSPRNTSDDAVVESALLHEIDETRGRKRSIPDSAKRPHARSAPSRSRSHTSQTSEETLSRIPSYLQPTKSSAKKKVPRRQTPTPPTPTSDGIPPPPPEDRSNRSGDPSDDNFIPVTTLRSSSTRTLPVAPILGRSSGRCREDVRRTTRRSRGGVGIRSRSAPHVSSGWQEGIRVPSLGGPARNRNRHVRQIVQLVTDLAALDHKGVKGPVTQDNGWHIVVCTLEKQLRAAQHSLQQVQAMREDKKVKSARDIEAKLVSQMTAMEVFYEEKLRQKDKEKEVLGRLNIDLKKETVELKKLLHQQAKHIIIPSVTPRELVDSVAEAVIIAEKEELKTAPPSVATPVQVYTPNETDNASELVPVHLFPKPNTAIDTVQGITLTPPPMSEKMPLPQSLRSSVMIMTPPPTAPSPISPPWKESTPLSPTRQYLELVEKSALADQLVNARMELSLARQENDALRGTGTGMAPSPQFM